MVSGRISRIVQASPVVKIFGIKLEKLFDFKPGQFVMVSSPSYVDKIGKGPKRAYSIASAPGGELELVVKINPGPCFSAHLDSLKVGDVLVVDGPYGKFVLKEPVVSETVFVAGGTGIAPLISMLRYIKNKNPPKVKLLFGIKTLQDFLYREELESLCGWVDVVVCLSQEKCEGFVHGRVTSVLLEHVKPTSQVYLCGSPDMVKDVVVLLEERCVLPENIHKEQW